MRAKLTYLDHSGFLLETKKHVLIFDYSNNQPQKGKTGLKGGVIDPAQLGEKEVLVFVSHSHMDHYNRVIFSWETQAPNIHYILSDDIAPHPGATMMGANEEKTVGEVRIRTLLSTDQGVAFLVFVEGLTIYFAGDLNWWHWQGEDPAWNRAMAEDYQEQIDHLKGMRIDVAFVPVDPRLAESSLLGIDYLMETADVGIAIPMHFWGQQKEAAKALLTTEYQDRVVLPMQRGQTVEV